MRRGETGARLRGQPPQINSDESLPFRCDGSRMIPLQPRGLAGSLVAFQDLPGSCAPVGTVTERASTPRSASVPSSCSMVRPQRCGHLSPPKARSHRGPTVMNKTRFLMAALALLLPSLSPSFLVSQGVTTATVSAKVRDGEGNPRSGVRNCSAPAFRDRVPGQNSRRWPSHTSRNEDRRSIYGHCVRDRL